MPSERASRQQVRRRGEVGESKAGRETEGGLARLGSRKRRLIVTCLQNADLNLWAGMAPSVIARVGSGCWIVGPIALAAVAIVWAHGALARLVLNAIW